MSNDPCGTAWTELAPQPSATRVLGSPIEMVRMMRSWAMSTAEIVPAAMLGTHTGPPATTGAPTLLLTGMTASTFHPGPDGSGEFDCCGWAPLEQALNIRAAATAAVRPGLYAEVRLSDVSRLQQRAGRVGHDDVPGLHHVPAAGRVQRQERVLLDPQDRGALLGKFLDDLEDRLHKRWRQPQRRFVKKEHARAGHHGPADG